MEATVKSGRKVLNGNVEHGMVRSIRITVNSIGEAQDEISYRKQHNPDQIHSVEMKRDGRLVIVSKDVDEYTDEIVDRVMRTARNSMQNANLRYKW